MYTVFLLSCPSQENSDFVPVFVMISGILLNILVLVFFFLYFSKVFDTCKSTGTKLPENLAFY